VEAFLRDLRYAFRNLAANPGFAALTTICLGVGIGVNSTLFSVVDTLAIRPLPFKDQARLVALRTVQPKIGVDNGGVSWLELQDWTARAHTFDDIAANRRQPFTVTERQESERCIGEAITANLFPMIGAQPIAGRLFTAEDDRPGAPAVVILGNAMWRRKFLGDPAVVGRTITLNGKPATVVGIMPERFEYPDIAQLWVPVAPLDHAIGRGARPLNVMARLKDGVALDVARSDIARVAADLERSFKENEGWSATAIPLREDLIPADTRLLIFTMMGAVCLVLAIACANVANLLLSRATARQREMAVRTALGAGRGRIIRQLLTESVVIGLASIPLGIVIAMIGLRMLTSAIPVDDPIPYYIDWSMNWRVLVYVGIVAVFTGIVFGLAPALQAADGQLHHALKDGGRGTATSARRNRTRNLLVVVEIALAVILLVGASLFVRSFLAMQRVDAGIETGRLMTLRFSMTGDQYSDPNELIRRTKDIVERVGTTAGVESVFASSFVPLSGGGNYGPVVTELTTPEPGHERETNYLGVTSRFLTTLGVPLVAGRDFTLNEGIERSGVAIVNQTFARQLFPNRQDVIGQRIRRTDPGAEWLTIVGLFGDARLWNVRDDEPTPIVLVPYAYFPNANTGLTIRVAGGPPAAVTSLVREEIRRADTSIPLFNLRTGDQNRAMSYWQERIFGWMFSIFGVIALLLAAIGIYGVLSYAVAQRTQEIGVRMALGASRNDVVRLVVGQGARLAGVGVAIGIVLSFGVTKVVRTFLYNVTPTDPLSFIGTAAFLAAVALGACYLPARRATAVDPIVALRSE
jgi:predicted permease